MAQHGAVPGSPPGSSDALGLDGTPSASSWQRWRTSWQSAFSGGSSAPTPSYCRLVRRNGSSNVVLVGAGRGAWAADWYHVVVDLTWYKLLGLCLLAYLALNAAFATLYWAVDGVIDHNHMGMPTWFVAFFFSVQTQDTIGYGSLSPANRAANVITGLQSWLSTLAYAVLTGITFAKISRPSRIKRNILFSSKAVITNRAEAFVGDPSTGMGTYTRGQPSLVFRVANVRRSALCDPHFNLLCLYYDPASPTEDYVIQELNFELNQQVGRVRGIAMSIPYLGLPWHVVHHIDHTSPLHGKGPEGLRAMRVEVVAVVDGIDEVCADNWQAKWSYVADDIVWDADFEPMISVAKKTVVERHLGAPGQRHSSVVNLPQHLLMDPASAHSETHPLLAAEGGTVVDGVVLVDYTKFHTLDRRHG